MSFELGLDYGFPGKLFDVFSLECYETGRKIRFNLGCKDLKSRDVYLRVYVIDGNSLHFDTTLHLKKNSNHQIQITRNFTKGLKECLRKFHDSEIDKGIQESLVETSYDYCVNHLRDGSPANTRKAKSLEE